MHRPITSEEKYRVLPKDIAVAVLGAIAIAASGCGGDSDSASEAKFRSGFKKRFATAPSALLWYDRITGMEVVDGRLEITTDLDPDTDDVLSNARAYAEAICQGVTNFSFEGKAEGIETTSVMGLDGVPLAQCRLIWPDADSDAEAQSPFDIAKFRAEVMERFGTPPNEAPWYRHITAIDWADGQLEVTTDLDESESRKIPCGLLWGLAFEQADRPNSFGLAVVGSDGEEFGGCA